MSEWISFEDELPVIGKQILIAYNVGDGIKVGQGSRWPENANNPNGKYPWYFCDATIFGAEHVRYWMELPEAPKEEK